MTCLPRQQSGLSLITAIFIVVGLALIALFVVRSVGMQQAQNNQALVGLRADYAARAGLEWGAARALLSVSNCGGSNMLNIEGVDVTVVCDLVDVTEAGATYQVFSIQSDAHSGVQGEPEFAQRRLTARFTNKL